RLKRFFISDDFSYSVKKDIRELCLFSSHSVLRDPPFSRIDLISCRNLLIYFGMEFQKIVVPVFHFALRPRGYLFLGTSENVTQYTDLFVPVERKHRIFQRRDNMIVPLRLPRGSSSLVRHGSRDASESGVIAVDLRRAAESRVMEQFAPAHVVVNREGEILYYSARTGKFLEPAPGLPNRQIVSMARRGLRGELHGALREAMERRRRVERHGVAVELDTAVQLADLVVEPLGDSGEDPLFLVLFREVGQPTEPRSGQTGDLTPAEAGSLEQMERELRDTRDRLQVIVEEYETAAEELKSSNEELQSMNEELQSTNEELETSKEELQSVNEELQTVNSELNVKVDEADRANTDLRNVFESTEIATIFLDRNFMVRSFTPAVTKIFNLITGDRGRPLGDIVSTLHDGELRRDVESVIDDGKTIQRSISRKDDEAHYQMRIMPYRGQRGGIDGALVTFVDVTALNESEQHQRNLVQELNHRVRNMLASVSAMASQTLRHNEAGNELRDIFMVRIQSMASAYNLVSRESWGEVTLREVAETQVAAYMDGESRIALGGPDIFLKPAAALAFGMVMHELTTNSTKYGALSNGKGKVNIDWSVKDDAIVVQWAESGGPAVKKPTSKGLGSSLIESEVKLGLRGKSKLDYRPEGLVASLTVPVDPTILSIG
ncbi:MAG TPA: PAS domain-containing protein, partial [Xanthobacteraceae bacterium]|nr:PAS domain-containing protein [Xanthobacteraceae bacterium]